MGLLNNVVSSITGKVDKALLCVKKPAPAKTSGGADGLLGAAASAAGLGGLVGGSISNVDLRAKLAARKQGFLSGLTSSAENMAKSSGYHVLQVKYNPSKIKFSSSAESRMAPGAGGAGVNMQVQSMLPAGTTMQVELLFDDENHQDAFMWEKFTNVSTGSMLSSAAGLASNIFGDGYTVQREIEGMIALITQSETRQVVFYWGDVAFAGIVTEIQAKYTMFNPIGHPIRGTVTLTIHQGGPDADGKGEDSYWNDAFDKLFDGGGLLSKAASSVGNVLNLK